MTPRPNLDSDRHTPPQETCDHEESETSYLERADGQHEVLICAECTLILEDRSRPEPDNVRGWSP